MSAALHLADPVVVAIVSFALAAIFLTGAADKLKARDVFVSVVQAYGLLPIPLVVVFSFAIAVAELLIGAALLIPATWPFSQTAALGLLVIVSGAIVINLLRGRTELDCGCGGASADQPLSWGLVLRNVGLGALIALTLIPLQARALTSLDYATMAVGTVALFGLYAATNQLLANAPRVASLRF
ncbi:MAG: DoxX family protein [Gammaproteobacteria bacterium]|nr:DoxX family protein [Gammaproteobacteria bacterium]